LQAELPIRGGSIATAAKTERGEQAQHGKRLKGHFLRQG
jgi:hypothetical protein